MTARVIQFPRRLDPVELTDPALGLAVTPPSGPPTPPGDPAEASAPLKPSALARPPRVLTAEEQALQTRMFQAYFEGRRPAKGHAADSIKGTRRRALEFAQFVGQPLWEITEADFESWSAHLGLERNLTPSSQRTMQGAVATFFNYLVENAALQNEALRLFGKQVSRIATSDNRVVHSTDANGVRARRYLTDDETTLAFAAYDAVIEAAAEIAPGKLRYFQRDKAMFYVYYGFGLRLQEGQQLNLLSFSPNPDLPELGIYGAATVVGKGSRGSGPRTRTVPTIHPDLPLVLTWYVEHVRPQFETKSEDARKALWLSDRGRRLSRASISARFKHFLTSVGLDPTLFSPHGLRHMAVSHEAAANVPLAFTQAKVGHAHASTTQRYTHLPDDFMRTIAKNIVRQSLQQQDDE
ncbi:tyrosine-type recombinase/integrase [Lysobacter arenosi]|uniref:Tyrosine-type recombinase/integrase n=1 Tax=Lysobacter arenosi TaxID=2795387 RepID=A0ABX7RAE6_9GAMM|nr:tyrosine-type recombinase/integrase [Lysobacter arenosi]QSX74458.1 tyrosine-type recombinase/integrase [Lysobacter arenosi]